MDFYAVLDQVLDLLRQRGRVTYRALKRQFDLDDALLEDLKVEIIEAHRLAVDEEGKVLVWTGDAIPVPPPAAIPVSPQERPPLAYTPAHLAEKIRTAKSALAGERKQVTVFFADIKDSTRLMPARTGPCRADYCHCPVPRHGYDFLAAPGRGRTDAGGEIRSARKGRRLTTGRDARVCISYGLIEDVAR